MRTLPLLLVTAVATLALAGPATAKTARFSDSQSFDIPAERLSVDVNIHDVSVDVGDVSRVEVDVLLEMSASSKDKAEDLIKQYIPEFEERDGELRIRSRRSAKKKLFNWNWGKSVRKAQIMITVPRNLDLDLATASGDVKIVGDMGDANLSCSTASGDVAVDGAMRRMDASTASGDVTLSLRDVLEHLEVSAASGDIEVDGGVVELASISTASGDIEVQGLAGEADLSTASGDVRARWNALSPDDEIDVDTASGDIRIVLPESVSVTGEANTNSGDIRSDFPGRTSDRGRTFRFGDRERGAAILHLGTASGDISILTR